MKSRMRENCTYGSVRGSRQAFHEKISRKECRDCLLDCRYMGGEKGNSANNLQLAEIERLIDSFKEKFKERTADTDNFITIHEIERMWGELQQKTLNIYSDMVCNLIDDTDERDLIRKKKESISKKESNCEHT